MLHRDSQTAPPAVFLPLAILSFDSLTVGREVGAGAFARVYKAQHRDLGTVAFKCLLPQHARCSFQTRLFLREAAILSRCTHSAIIKCHGVCQVPAGFPRLSGMSGLPGADAGSWGMVLEYCEGGPLSSMLVSQMSSPHCDVYTTEEALDWTSGLASALHYLQMQSPIIIHRDIKQDNVLITRGPDGRRLAKLADFGLHKPVDLDLSTCLRSRDVSERTSPSLPGFTSTRVTPRVSAEGAPGARVVQPQACPFGGPVIDGRAAAAHATPGPSHARLSRSPSPPTTQPLFFPIPADLQQSLVQLVRTQSSTHSLSATLLLNVHHSSSGVMPTGSRESLPSLTPYRTSSCGPLLEARPLGPLTASPEAAQGPWSDTWLARPVTTSGRLSADSQGGPAVRERPRAQGRGASPRPSMRLLATTSEVFESLCIAPSSTAVSDPMAWGSSDVTNLSPSPSFAIDTLTRPRAAQPALGDSAAQASNAGLVLLPPGREDSLTPSHAISAPLPTVATKNFFQTRPGPGADQQQQQEQQQRQQQQQQGTARSRPLSQQRRGSTGDMPKRPVNGAGDGKVVDAAIQGAATIGSADKKQSEDGGHGDAAVLVESSGPLSGSGRPGSIGKAKGSSGAGGRPTSPVSTAATLAVGGGKQGGGNAMDALAHLLRSHPSAAGLAFEKDWQHVFPLTGHTGSALYMAPEVFLKLPYNEKVDVFSLGVLMYEVFSRTLLLFTHIGTRGEQRTVDGYVAAVAGGFRPDRPANLDDGLWELIQPRSMRSPQHARPAARVGRCAHTPPGRAPRRPELRLHSMLRCFT